MIRLRHGSHFLFPGACLMEITSLLLARKTRPYIDWTSPEKTDLPRCLCKPISAAVQGVNDCMPEAELWRLAPLLPRLIRARHQGRELERIVQIRLAIWAARSVEDQVKPAGRERFEANLQRAEQQAWDEMLDYSVGIDTGRWTNGWSAALGVAVAAQDPLQRLTAVRDAARLVPPDDLPLWLSDLLDQHEKILADLGAWDPDVEYPPDDEVQEVVDAILASRYNIEIPDEGNHNGEHV